MGARGAKVRLCVPWRAAQDARDCARCLAASIHPSRSLLPGLPTIRSEITASMDWSSPRRNFMTIVLPSGYLAWRIRVWNSSTYSSTVRRPWWYACVSSLFVAVSSTARGKKSFSNWAQNASHVRNHGDPSSPLSMSNVCSTNSLACPLVMKPCAHLIFVSSFGRASRQRVK